MDTWIWTRVFVVAGAVIQQAGYWLGYNHGRASRR